MKFNVQSHATINEIIEVSIPHRTPDPVHRIACLQRFSFRFRPARLWDGAGIPGGLLVPCHETSYAY